MLTDRAVPQTRMKMPRTHADSTDICRMARVTDIRVKHAERIVTSLCRFMKVMSNFLSHGGSRFSGSTRNIDETTRRNGGMAQRRNTCCGCSHCTNQPEVPFAITPPMASAPLRRLWISDARSWLSRDRPAAAASMMMSGMAEERLMSISSGTVSAMHGVRDPKPKYAKTPRAVARPM